VGRNHFRGRKSNFGVTALKKTLNPGVINKSRNLLVCDKNIPRKTEKSRKKIQMALAKEDSLLPCKQWPLTQVLQITL
jgi:hypothetical protein